MKVGGNASATDFFTRHGGGALLNSGDTRAKYTSGVAVRYKEELERRRTDDERRCPEGIRLDGVDLSVPPAQGGPGSGAATPSGGAATPTAPDDFFATWDKPASPAPGATSGSASPQPAAPPPPPSIGRPAPRTVTSSSLRQSTGANGSAASSPGAAGPTASPAARRPGASRLTSGSANTTTTTSSGSALGAPKASRLGAKKAAAPIDFEAAQRKALEEEERIKRLGYDKKREEDEARERERREAEARRSARETGNGVDRGASPAGGYGARSGGASEKKAAPIRLGFGATMGAPAVAASTPASSRSSV